MSGENDMTTETEVINRYRILQNEVQMLSSKSTELDQDRQEHELVLEALNGADDGRKCFRFMGGVLVERTVGEVRPAVTRNRDNLVQALSQLNNNLDTRKSDLKALQEKYKIRETVRGTGGEGEQQQQSAEGSSGAGNSSSGVLV